MPGFRDPTYQKIGQPNTADGTQGHDEPVVGIWEAYTSPEDTYAQWIAAFAALGGVGVSFWAVRLVRDTLAVNRKVTDIAEKMLLDVERPHLFIDNVGAYVALLQEWFDLPEGKIPMPEVNYTIKNYGRTPGNSYRNQG